MVRDKFQRLPGSFQDQYTADANLHIRVGVFSVRMKIFRRPAGQVGCTDKSDHDRNRTCHRSRLECAIILHSVDTDITGLAAMWIATF